MTWISEDWRMRVFIRSLARLWVDKTSREGSRATEPGELSRLWTKMEQARRGRQG
jgi:hypothetical protein